MKKLLILFAVGALVVAFSMPAMAKVTIGGAVCTDVQWMDRDESFQRNLANTGFAGGPLQEAGYAGDAAWNQFDIGTGGGGTILYFKFVNKSGDLGMYHEFGLSSEGDRGTKGNDYTEGLESHEMYGWWQINDMFRLKFGQSKTPFAQLRATQGLTVWAHSGLGGFGNIAGDTDPNVQVQVKITDAISVDVAAVYPLLSAAEGSWDAEEEETVWPRWDVAMTGKFGPITINPSYMHYTTHYEWDLNTVAGASQADDKEIVCWAFSVPVSVGYGPVSVNAKATWGENIGNSGLNNGSGLGRFIWNNGAASWDRVNGIAKVTDADYDGYWVDAAFKFTPQVAFHIMFGSEDVKSDRPGQNNDYERNRQMWGLTLPITVFPWPNFTVTPSYYHYDWGSQKGPTGFYGAAVRDLGEETTYGVALYVRF